MNVLIACEESQEVCKAFRAKGHRAFSCDLQECSGGHPEWHIQGDVLPLLNGNCTFMTADTHTHTQDGRWDLIIAHPPCTYLTSCGSRWLFSHDHKIINMDRYAKALEAKDFFLMILGADCDRIAIENPAPIKAIGLPRYHQIIEPYQFGHPWKKRTCLWLKELPLLKGTELVKPTGCWVVQSGGNTCRVKLKNQNGCANNAKDRSKTFPGIARAMAEQWG